MTLAEIGRSLLEQPSVVILTHRRPDGDTAGSAAALCLGLRQLGRRAWVLDNRQFTARIAPYLEGLTRPDVPQDALVAAVDIASEALLSLDAEACGAQPQLAIDHHKLNSLPCPKYIGLGRPSCGEIILELLEQLGVTLTPQIADCLYLAVSTDTGCFKYAGTTADTHRAAARLIEAGAHAAQINKLFFDTKSFARLQLEARLTGSMERYAGGMVGLCVLPAEWLRELAVTEDDIDSISGFARTVDGVKIGIMIREVEDGLGKISVRTEAPYDASALCAQLGGGGHTGAAGASVPGGAAAARTAILDVLVRSGITL